MGKARVIRTFNVYDAELWTRFLEICKNHDRFASEVLHDLIEQYVKEHPSVSTADSE